MPLPIGQRLKMRKICVIERKRPVIEGAISYGDFFVVRQAFVCAMSNLQGCAGVVCVLNKEFRWVQ